MSFTDFITDNGRRVNRENFIHLIQIAQADGKIGEKEAALLHRYGKRFSLTDPEIDSLIKAEMSHIFAPHYDLEKRFSHLYDVVQIMSADNQITEEEKKLFRKIAIASSFSDESIPRLFEFLQKGIREGKDEEELFNQYKKAQYLRN